SRLRPRRTVPSSRLSCRLRTALAQLAVRPIRTRQTRRVQPGQAVVAVALLVVGVAGCGPQVHPPRAQPPPSVRPVTPAPTVTLVRAGRVVRAGTTVPFQAQAGVTLKIRASRPSLSRQRLSSSYGYAPARGYYVTFLVTLANTGRRPVDIGPGDFFVQVSRQGKVTTLMGNAPYSG